MDLTSPKRCGHVDVSLLLAAKLKESFMEEEAWYWEMSVTFTSRDGNRKNSVPGGCKRKQRKLWGSERNQYFRFERL